MNTMPALMLTGLLSAWCCAAVAQAPEQQPTNPPVTTATGGGGSQAETSLVNRFSIFAGSEDNARSLVTGLRQGSEITLTSPAGGGQPASSTTFTPPTRPMGYGNVRISLALAQEQLAQSGITQPTPAQLQTALMGPTTNGTGTQSTSTQFQGVLQMRADGMGWGQIANSMGVKLGHVMSGKTAPAPTAPSTLPSNSTAASTGSGSGIVTSAGTASTATQARARGNSASAHQSHGAGIVTAAGGSGAGTSASIRTGGGASGGVVTGTGAAAGSRASAAGVANGKGHAKP